MSSQLPTFRHVTPPLRLFQGDGCLREVVPELDRIGCSRAVVVCGGSMVRSGLLETLRDALGTHCVAVFDRAQGHSPLDSVETAAALLRTSGADAVIALGGGSAMVTARAASILAAEARPAQALCTYTDPSGRLVSPRLEAPKLPQFIVPTTPTTALFKAGSAVFATGTGRRLALFDPKTRAQSVFVAPQAVMSAPRALVLSAGVNALCAAIEGLCSNVGDPLADALLMHALRLLAGHFAQPTDLDMVSVRAELLLAAGMCGQGTDYASGGITSVLGHALGARFDVEAGLVNAVVLPHVMRFNGMEAKAGLQKVGAALALPRLEGAALIEAVIEHLSGMFNALSLPTRLRELSVPRKDLPAVADAALGDWFLKGNARAVSDAAQLAEILDTAW